METTHIHNLSQRVGIKSFDTMPPHIIKYMGSKRNIIENVVEGISSIYTGTETVCDLFAGTSVLSGAIGKSVSMHSNDIQEYSSLLANLYLANHAWVNEDRDYLREIIDLALDHYNILSKKVEDVQVDYGNISTLEAFNEVEALQRDIINKDFNRTNYYLFTKNFSGTYWSLDQCLWIDSIKAAADKYKGESIYYAIMNALMFAMAYNSQSTGHYAQFRDATNEASMNDIMIYRKKKILPLFEKKFSELKEHLSPNSISHKVTTLDYKDCLDQIAENSIVYADPPYCFVHYSRFYHALETLAKYDYPELKFKGRYRTDRHQSPFCIRTKVENAFKIMFQKINFKKSKLVLSYSNTGMISLERLEEIARDTFDKGYTFKAVLFDHQHSTMGRREDKSRDVKECILIIDKK